MSATGNNPLTPAQQNIWGSLIGGLKGNILSNLPVLIGELSAAGTTLVGAEAQDFDTMITSFASKIQTGESLKQAWADVSAPYVAAAKSDAWNAVLAVVTDGVGFIHGILTFVEAAL